MTNTQQDITKQALLAVATSLMKEYPDYQPDMSVTQVHSKNGVLIFTGECFLDEHGLPTDKSTQAFNMFKYLTQHLSSQYRLIDSNNT